MEDLSSNFEVRDALQKVVYRNVPKSTRTVNVAAHAVATDTIVTEGTL